MVDEKYQKVCEDLGWDLIDEGGDCIAISQYSPAGEDFSFIVSRSDFVRDVSRYVTSFDEDDHVAMWVAARENTAGVPSISELVDDAKAIHTMLRELDDALRKVK